MFDESDVYGPKVPETCFSCTRSLYQESYQFKAQGAGEQTPYSGELCVPNNLELWYDLAHPARMKELQDQHSMKSWIYECLYHA